MTVPEHLAAQPQLSQRLQGMLPAGMTVDQAADGFKNLGQFVAAVNVSKNLGIPFDQLKAQVTGPSPKSLGKRSTRSSRTPTPARRWNGRKPPRGR